MLNLSGTDQPIQAMLERAQDARLQPSGARRYELHHHDHTRLLDSPIIAITYIPSVKLNEKMILDRFGKADNNQQAAQQENIIICNYQ